MKLYSEPAPFSSMLRTLFNDCWGHQVALLRNMIKGDGLTNNGVTEAMWYIRLGMRVAKFVHALPQASN